MLTLFGLVAVRSMLVCYALEERLPWLTFAFGVAYVEASGYDWLAGTWPFGMIERICAEIAIRE